MFNFGIVNDFSDTNSIENPVIAALAKVINLPRFKGAVYQRMSSPQVPITQKQFDVYSRSKSTRNGVIGTAGSGTDWGSTTDATALPIASSYLLGLSVGHVLKVDDEVMVIKSVDRSGNTIDVFARGAGGTSGATHTTGAAFSVIGFAGRDTDLKNVSSVSENTLKYSNYIQTVFETLDWEKGAELLRKGLSEATVLGMLRQEAAVRVAEMLSVSAIHGYKQLGTVSIPYMSAGLLSQLEDDVSATRPIQRYNGNSAALDETKLRAALDQIFAVGSPDAIILNLANANKFLKFDGAGLDVMITGNRQDTGVGRFVDHYDYNGQRLDLIVDTDMPTSKVAICTMADLKKGWLSGDELKTVKEPDVSSREHRDSIQGSVGFLVENVGYSHLEIYGLV